MTNAREMTLGDLIDRRNGLENDIRESITKFVDETGVQVQTVNIEFMEVSVVGNEDEEYILDHVHVVLRLPGDL